MQRGGRRWRRVGSGTVGGVRLPWLARVGSGVLALLAVAVGSASAHDRGDPTTDAGEVLAGERAGDATAGAGGRVAAASDPGLLPGVDGPVELLLFAVVGLLATVLAFGLLVAVAKLTYGLVTGTADWLTRAAGVLPLSEGQVRVATVALLAFSAAAFVGIQAQENTTSLWDSEDGPAGRANDFKQQGLNGDPVGSLDADTVLAGDSYSGPPYDRPTPDTDGDRLKDSWEERGMTPDGVRLPGADPNHKDLYVQVNYGANVSAYTAAEKRALRASWAKMPVDNPDGEEGIRLHLVEGERLPTNPSFSSMEGRSINRFYTPEYVGQRRCVYHQVVVGRVDLGDTVGVAGVPGYTSVVEERRVQFNGSDTTRRVHVTNHELLHNVVGTLPDGGTHTSQGWLVPEVTPDQDYLSPAAEAVLDERIEGSGYFQHEVCADATATATG